MASGQIYILLVTCLYERDGLRRCCVFVLKLDALLCLNHCRSALLEIPPFLGSWPPHVPPIPRILAQKHRARAVARAPALSSGRAPALEITPTYGCDHAFLRPGPGLLLKHSNFASSSRFRPPSSVRFVGQIAWPSPPLAIVAVPCQLMAVAAGPDSPSVTSHLPI